MGNKKEESTCESCMQPHLSDESLHEKIIDETCLHRGSVFRTELMNVRLKDGTIACREIVRHSGGAAIIPIDEDMNVYFVRQFRAPFGQVLLEVPAGKLEETEEPKACAMRELREETGLVAAEIDYLGAMYPSPGYCSEKIYLFMARRLTQLEQQLDKGEHLKVIKASFDQALKWIDQGKIHDAKTIVSILKAARRMHKT